MAIQRLSTLLLVPLIAACTAHFPVNPPLEHYDPNYGYRVPDERVRGKSQELFLALTFSGGGRGRRRCLTGSWGHLPAPR